LKKIAAVLLGLVTMVVLFPTGSVSGCPGGADEDCETRSTSLLVDYAGDNGAIGMLIAFAVGIAVATVTYLLLNRVGKRARSMG
jgi:hypothetical protein